VRTYRRNCVLKREKGRADRTAEKHEETHHKREKQPTVLREKLKMPSQGKPEALETAWQFSLQDKTSPPASFKPSAGVCETVTAWV
jgi:hypothetical protein